MVPRELVDSEACLVVVHSVGDLVAELFEESLKVARLETDVVVAVLAQEK